MPRPLLFAPGSGVNAALSSHSTRVTLIHEPQ